MRDGDGLFEVEPVGRKRPQGRPAAADKAFRAFDRIQVLLLAVVGRVALDGTKLEAEAADAAEDQAFGVDGKEADLPAELDRREERLAKPPRCGEW